MMRTYTVRIIFTTGLQRGFALVELLVVISILTILSSVIASAALRARRSAQETRCLSNLRQIFHASELYIDDYALEESGDDHDFVSLVTTGYLKDENLLCPLDWRADPLDPGYSSYWKIRRWNDRRPEEPFVVCPFHGAFWQILWGDGHIRKIRRYARESDNIFWTGKAYPIVESRMLRRR